MNIITDPSPKGAFVSIVMAVFNGEQFLQEAIDSVLAQTHKNFEFIIIDDGSDDNSASIIAEYAKYDNRIQYYYQSNAGLAAALNYGLKMANAEIIARMDADDIMLPNRLEEQVPFLLDHPEVTVVSCLAYYINSKGKILGKVYSDLITPQDCEKYISDNQIIFCLHPGVLFRKSPILKIGGYNENLPCGQDTDLWNKLAENGNYIIVMREILMKYRIHQNSIMSSFERVQKLDWIIFNIYQRRNNKNELSFSEFSTIEKSKPFLQKVSSWKLKLGDLYYRRSGFLYGEKNYIQFLFFLLAAFILRPIYVVSKIKRQFII